MPREDLTIAEVAERLGVEVRTVQKWLQRAEQDGEEIFIGAYRAGKRTWLIPQSALIGFQRPRMGRPKRKREQNNSRESGESE